MPSVKVREQHHKAWLKQGRMPQVQQRGYLHSLVVGVETADAARHKAVAVACGVQPYLDLQLPVLV